MSSTDTCASCDQFPLEQHQEGIAVCKIRQENHKFSDRACVLHNRSKNESARRQIVVKLIEQYKEK